MNIVFRVDASLEMGSGHVMRCLTLADELRRQGHDCAFLSRKQPGDLINMMTERGYPVHELPVCDAPAAGSLAHSHWLKGGRERDARECGAVLRNLRPDWLVVDHYGIDKEWELEVRACVKQLLVIDDLADRSHDCDILLDQNLGQTDEMYRRRVPDDCQILTGCRYALLRPEFADYRERSLKYRRGRAQVDRVLVTMGGVDKDNITEKALKALELSALDDKTGVTVVLGKQAPWLAGVKAQAANSRLTVRVLSNVSNMAELMSQSDLAVGAAGSTSWERCCLGLPTLMCVLADNQRGIARALENAGAAVVVSDPLSDFSSQIDHLKQCPQELERLSGQAASLVDGQGVKRVVSHMGNEL